MQKVSGGNVKRKTKNSRETKRLIYYCLMLAIPVLQFCLCYIYVNFNSIAMAFQHFSLSANGTGYVSTFAGLDNFKVAWNIFINGWDKISVSLIYFAIQMFIVMTLALIFSYYISKKYLFAGLFRVLLYLPHILSSVVLVLLYKYVVTDVYAQIATKLTGERVYGLLDNLDTEFGTILFYNIWVGFGMNVMLFTNAMSSIDTSLVESAQLDGANIVQEFLHITIPMIFPTFVTFVVVGFAGIFTNQMNLFTFYGTSGAATFDNFGYFLYRKIQEAGVTGVLAFSGLDYTQLSALGVIITVILVPITLGVRYLLQKFGPSTD